MKIICSILLSALCLGSCVSCGPEETEPLQEIPAETEQIVTDNDETAGNPEVIVDSDCPDQEDVVLTAAPIELDDLSYIFPMGLMTNAHVTPVDHQYYFWIDTDVPVERYPVYSPADGYITYIEWIGVDYRLVIEHSCDVYSIYIHLEQLAGPLEKYDGQVAWGESVSERIPVKAGELIAFDGGTNGFDFSLHDERVILPGFIDPESYIVEPWKIHTVDPYDYFEESVRSRLLEKNLRQTAPLGGKIDHDIRGSLSGNWFVENTNGYAGITRDNGPVKPEQQIGYWNTHLAVAPDPIDPSVTMVSFGWFDGGCLVGAVKSPQTAPSDITPETGVVKWELWNWFYAHRDTGEPWGHIDLRMADDLVLEYGQELYGTVLFQLLEGERLRMEAFPGKKADEVAGFSEASETYTR